MFFFDHEKVLQLEGIQIYDYVNSELTHNKTYAYRLPPTFIEQARHWANYHENGVFSDDDINGIGNSKSMAYKKRSSCLNCHL